MKDNQYINHQQQIPVMDIPPSIAVQPKINSYLMGGTRFDLPERYTPIKPIGHGAYGVVVYDMYTID
jgi:hypothetical protein